MPEPATDAAFQREKWDAELRLRERELAIKEQEAAVKTREAATKEQEASIKAQEAATKVREQQLKSRELRIKVAEMKRSRWANPLVLAVLAAALAGFGNVVVALFNSYGQNTVERVKAEAQQRIERGKADAALILEVIKTNNDEAKARANLQFLITTGLITDRERREELTRYLAGPGPVPSLPAQAPAPAPTPSSTSEGSVALACTVSAPADMAQVADVLEKRLRENDGFEVKRGTLPDEMTLEVIPTRGVARVVSPSGVMRIGVRPQSSGVRLAVSFVGVFQYAAIMPFLTGGAVQVFLRRLIEDALGADHVSCGSG